MILGFRWYGDDDPVRLDYICQVPVIKGIVTALYDVPVGEPWPKEKLAALKKTIEEAGLSFAAVESIPVHEDIKLGRPTRDRYIDNYRQSVRAMGELGIPVLCYNFMPVFDWTRTDLSMAHPDGSTSLSYDHEAVEKIDIAAGELNLPGWATRYTREELSSLLDAYREVDDEALWKNLGYFLEAVVPAAEEAGVRMGIHPDDPPWPIFGLPRIIRDEGSLERLMRAVDSPANGVTFCTGSFGPSPAMDLIAAVGKYAAEGRVPFVHVRNIKMTGPLSFYETAHPTDCGDVDVYGILKVLAEAGFDGVIRPDHGRMVWGETGRPGYGLYDRALGAMYLAGLWEGISKTRR